MKLPHHHIPYCFLGNLVLSLLFITSFCFSSCFHHYYAFSCCLKHPSPTCFFSSVFPLGVTGLATSFKKCGRPGSTACNCLCRPQQIALQLSLSLSLSIGGAPTSNLTQTRCSPRLHGDGNSSGIYRSINTSGQHVDVDMQPDKENVEELHLKSSCLDSPSLLKERQTSPPKPESNSQVDS